VLLVGSKHRNSVPQPWLGRELEPNGKVFTIYPPFIPHSSLVDAGSLWPTSISPVFIPPAV